LFIISNLQEMKYTSYFSLFLILLLFTYCNNAKNTEKSLEKNQVNQIQTPINQEIIQVEYPETYELANIILALTDYGIKDKWQVRKNFPYYEEMRTYFQPYEDHPLLDSVNFSKKRWAEYLSFRTDAYAFEFNEQHKLQRINDFQSFEIRTFDKNIALIEDFARQSNFRAFFKQHQAYYDKVVNNYKQEYMLPEMKQFLTEQFDDFFGDKKYSIVVSPFVYAQNLHRDIDSTWTADFPSISDALAEGKAKMTISEKSTEVHTLFTEMDHGYVNPTSDKYPIREKFQSALWDDESGYGGNGTDVFNEYMTWAVFDLFNKKHFPDIADEINLYWHFQNDTRGFPYSYLFGQQLQKLYGQHQGKKKITELYPEMLKWCQEIQKDLSKPTIISPKDSIVVDKNSNLFKLTFSEPLEQVDSFNILLATEQKNLDTLTITPKDHQLEWQEDGKKLSFQITKPDLAVFYIQFNWWGTKIPLRNPKGTLLQSSSYIKVIQ